MAFAIPDWSDLIGKPWVMGGRGPDAFDCYGLMIELARRAGVSLPDYASPEEIAKVADVIAQRQVEWTPCGPVPGALVTLGIPVRKERTLKVCHVGMVLPYGRLIHSWERSGGVCVERLETWTRRISGFYEFPQGAKA